MSAREQTIADFQEVVGGPAFTRVLQRGRDPQTARFSLELPDATFLHIGTIDTLWSYPKFAKTLAVTVGIVLKPLKAADWLDCIQALIRDATDVEETPGEAVADRILDWLDQYARSASTDRGAISQRLPFTEDDHLYVSAENFQRWIKREYTEQLPISDVRTALTDLGFHATKLSYDVPGKTRKRTSARYYRSPIGVLEDHANE